MPFPNASCDTEIDLAAFHNGRREVIRCMYQANGIALLREVRHRIGPAGAEAVVHQVFVDLLRKRSLREQLRGGAIFSWPLFDLATVGHAGLVHAL